MELAALCETEPGRAKPSPKVGAVAVTANGELIAEAHRGSINPGDHAEYCLIAGLGEGAGALAGVTVYTILEPCTQRTPPKVPCVEWLIDKGVAVVYIGTLDPDPRIRELGWSALRDANIEVRDFTAAVREELEALNASFLDRFRVVTGPRGQITFDYMQNDGSMRIEHEGSVFNTKWSMAGSGSIHAYGSPGTIAQSRTARDFDEIDDPGLFEFAGHSKRAREGQIVIFKNQDGFSLVRVDAVLAGPDRGDPHTQAVVSYELRLSD